VKWLQNSAEGLSQTFGHPTVVTKRSGLIFESVIGYRLVDTNER